MTKLNISLSASYESCTPQQVTYRDVSALHSVQNEIAARPPLVKPHTIDKLRHKMVRVARGEAFVIQGGPCAEPVPDTHGDIQATIDDLSAVSSLLEDAANVKVVSILRGAGQSCKPRSQQYEAHNGMQLLSYRGDMINGPAFSTLDREPDPKRMLIVHSQAHMTLAMIKLAAREIFTSHEMLHLPYEELLVRDAYSSSAAMLWIGDRTADPLGLHAQRLSELRNPIGLKCGPAMTPDKLSRTLAKLDPNDESGRLTLILRMGAGEIEDKLPKLLRVIKGEQRHTMLFLDPMHGNPLIVNGVKTRRVADILNEISLCFEICRRHDMKLGGIHLEMSGREVTECLGENVSAQDLTSKAYETSCDARLNPLQTRIVTAHVAKELTM